LRRAARAAKETATRSRELAAIWGVLGVTAIFAQAMIRLAPLAYEGVIGEPQLVPGAIAAVWSAVMAWLEGYRGFQKRWVPLALERAFGIDTGSKVEIALAPFKTLGVWRAEPRVRRRAWAMVIGITALVLAVRQLPQPWRGVIDSGVVVGLAWGTAALLFGLIARLGNRRRAPGVDAS